MSVGRRVETSRKRGTHHPGSRNETTFSLKRGKLPVLTRGKTCTQEDWKDSSTGDLDGGREQANRDFPRESLVKES